MNLPRRVATIMYFYFAETMFILVQGYTQET